MVEDAQKTLNQRLFRRKVLAAYVITTLVVLFAVLGLLAILHWTDSFEKHHNHTNSTNTNSNGGGPAGPPTPPKRSLIITDQGPLDAWTAAMQQHSIIRQEGGRSAVLYSSVSHTESSLSHAVWIFDTVSVKKSAIGLLVGHSMANRRNVVARADINSEGTTTFVTYYMDLIQDDLQVTTTASAGNTLYIFHNTQRHHHNLNSISSNTRSDSTPQYGVSRLTLERTGGGGDDGSHNTYKLTYKPASSGGSEDGVPPVLSHEAVRAALVDPAGGEHIFMYYMRGQQRDIVVTKTTLNNNINNNAPTTPTLSDINDINLDSNNRFWNSVHGHYTSTFADASPITLPHRSVSGGGGGEGVGGGHTLRSVAWDVASLQYVMTTEGEGGEGSVWYADTPHGPFSDRGVGRETRPTISAPTPTTIPPAPTPTPTPTPTLPRITQQHPLPL